MESSLRSRSLYVMRISRELEFGDELVVDECHVLMKERSRVGGVEGQMLAVLN